MTHSVIRIFIPVLILTGITGCDLPSKSPDFAFTADVNAPLLFDKTFLFLGPDAEGNDALIDTTRNSFDSLFTVSSRSEEIFIIQEVDDFDVGEIDDPIEPISIDPVDVGVAIGTLANPEFSGSVNQSVGVYEAPELAAPGVPPAIEGSDAYYPVAVSDFLVRPENDLVDMTGSTIEAYHISASTSSINEMSFDLTNNLGEEITDGTFTSGSAPWVVFEDASGTEYARFQFDRAPQPGQTASLVASIASTTLPAGTRFRLDIGTPSGFQPISDNPGNVPVAVSTTTLEYDGVSLDNLGPQTGVGNSNNDLTVSSEVDFTGMVTQSGSVTMHIVNDLEIPLQVDDIRLSNIDAVDTYPQGHVFASTFGQIIAPRGTEDIELDLNHTGISKNIRAQVVFSSPGSPTAIDVVSTDGIDISVNGGAEIQKVFLRPQAEEFRDTGRASVDLEDIHFNDPDDFVEIESGSLDISDLVNGFDLTMDLVEISFPTIRLSPYGPGDSLVVRFQGSQDQPSSYLYSRVVRNEGPRNISVSLASLRMFTDVGDIPYNIVAISEASNDVREIVINDEISSTVAARDIMLSAVQASIEPMTFNVTEDLDGNGQLDVLSPDESITASLSGVSDLVEFGFTSLSLAGTELTLELTSSVDANIVLYAAIAGIDSEGNVMYLGGKGASEVAQSDSMAGKFSANGSVLTAADLMRIEISDTESSQTSIVLTEDNSNIDDFINGLPTSIRLASMVILEPEGGQVSLDLPFEFDIGIGASIPLRFRGDATLDKLTSADLSGLSDLTNPDEVLSLNEATLRLGYENEIPLGLEARISVIDAGGNVVATVPSLSQDAITVEAASANEFGTSSEVSIGVGELSIDRETLVLMATGSDLQIELKVRAEQSGVRRVRSTDTIQMNLTGEFDLRVSTGN